MTQNPNNKLKGTELMTQSDEQLTENFESLIEQEQEKIDQLNEEDSIEEDAKILSDEVVLDKDDKQVATTSSNPPPFASTLSTKEVMEKTKSGGEIILELQNISDIEEFIAYMRKEQKIAELVVNKDISDFNTVHLKPNTERARWKGNKNFMLALSSPFVIANKVQNLDGTTTIVRSAIDIGIPIHILRWDDECGVFFCVRKDIYNIPEGN